MKRHLGLLAILLLGLAPLRGQVQDTLYGLDSHYFHPQWYDQCPDYTDPSYVVADRRHFALGTFDHVCHMDSMSVGQSGHTYAPLRVVGLAAMVLRSPADLGWTGFPHQIAPSATRLPEHLLLYQGTPDSDTMLLIDSAQWNSSVPHLLKLPQNEFEPDNPDNYLYCYLYEAFFKEPVTIDSAFFISGTLRNDKLHPVYYDYRHLPTFYIYVCNRDYSQCTTCQIGTPRFYQATLEGDWHRVNSGLAMASGPFLLILDDGQTYQPPTYCQLTVSSNNNQWGTVAGGGSYPQGETAWLVPTPAQGGQFLAWNDGLTDNPRPVVLAGDTTFVGIFAEPVGIEPADGSSHLQLTLSPNPAHGTVAVGTGRNGHYLLVLYDNAGRRLRSLVFEGNGTLLDLGALSAGQYLIAVSDGSASGVKSFIKQ